MTPLETVGILTLILIGTFIIIALILLIPGIGLLKKAKNISSKVNNVLNPTMERLNDTTAKLTGQMQTAGEQMQKLNSNMSELMGIFAQGKMLLHNPYGRAIGAGFGIIQNLVIPLLSGSSNVMKAKEPKESAEESAPGTDVIIEEDVLDKKICL